MYKAWTHDNVHNAHSLQFAQTTTTLTDNEAKKRRWIKIVAAHNFTLNAMQRMHAGSESMSIWWECECEFNARITTISYNRWLIWMHFQFANYTLDSYWPISVSRCALCHAKSMQLCVFFCFIFRLFVFCSIFDENIVHKNSRNAISISRLCRFGANFSGIYI